MNKPYGFPAFSGYSRAMKILVVQHQNLGGPEIFGAALEALGVCLDIRNDQAGDALPDDGSDHDALLVLGGSMNALEGEAYPYLPQSVALIRLFHDQAKPVLGICLGAQLIARAFGGRVYVLNAPELGFVEVALNGTADPILEVLGPPLPVMQWHYDSFDLPKQAELLATSETCRNQAFRMGPTTHGLQFHFEVSSAQVESWLASSSEMPDDALHEDFQSRIGGELEGYMDDSLDFCRNIAARWVLMIAARLAA